jgi:NADPH-dependent curcumin reductase CurA
LSSFIRRPYLHRTGLESGRRGARMDGRQVHLIRRPQGALSSGDFRVVETTTPAPAEGQAQVQNLIMSVDPYMRPRFDADQVLNVPLQGGGIGRVTLSRTAKLKPGDLVRHGEGFQEHFNAEGTRLSLLRPDPELSLSVYLHALGATGMTAYGGLLDVGALRDGEQVFVSTAAGAVGSVAAQIARLKGCFVVGSTGAEDKRTWLLDEAGLDHVINYRAQPIAEALAAVTPRGLDVYFENVGGDHLDAALARMNSRGRVAVCGMISTYQGQGAPVFALPTVIYGRVTIRGFVGSDFPHLAAAFASDMTAWLKSGEIRYQETILEGLERTADGLVGLFAGLNRGKMLIRIAD